MGDTADVEIDAFADTTFIGVVTKIANSATVKGLGTQEQVTNFEVTVALLDYNERFRPGMSSTVDIITETRDDVLKIPIQAVTVRPKEKLEKKPGVEERSDSETSEEGSDNEEKKPEMIEVIFCVEDNKAVSKPVKLGISDDTHYALISGIEEGEEVVTGPFRVLSRTLKSGDVLNIEKNKKEDENAD
jgi:HlyD family secretion protein